MDIALFDFNLPDAAIALRPVRPRSAARLLHFTPQGLTHHTMAQLPTLLRAGDALVLNDVAVLPARLFGQRAGKTRLHEIVPSNMTPCAGTLHNYICFIKHSAALKPNDILHFSNSTTQAQVVQKLPDGTVELAFSDCLVALLQQVGRTPLPPYILKHRADDAADTTDYQSTIAQQPRAVAASTAGLHFDAPTLAALQAAGVSVHTITLEVGAGTFRPVNVDDITQHQMHSERAILSPAVAQALNATKAAGGRVIAVGTTALRTLESATLPNGQLQAFNNHTQLFVTPSYQFKFIDGLVTNFHPPRSTPLMLTAAIAGLDRLMQAYDQALAMGYRWCSYGDACLVWRGNA